MVYQIKRDYIRFGNARSGQRIGKVLFLVAHDIGDGGSTARQNQAYFDNHQPSASAQAFIDDKEILEIIPLDEKAWHVRYGVTGDNAKYGDDANDAAIGVELCHGGGINFKEAYKRYVWYFAYLCRKYNLNPHKHIIDHAKLDPGRRSDPHNALNPRGITFSDFLNDVAQELGAKSNPKTEAKGTTVNDDQFTIRVKVNKLHTYGTADWNDKSGPLVNEDNIFTVKRTLTVDGYKMYQLISGWYITASEKYVEVFEKPKKKKSKQKYLQVTANQLWTYHTPNWNDKAEIIHEDDVYTIIEDKFKVGGGYMYQIKSGLYVTANEKYVNTFEK